MRFVKSLRASLLKSNLLWQDRTFLTVSALWPFDLCGDRPLLETDFLPAMAGADDGAYLPVDTGYPKPQGEFLVMGSCHPPGGKAVQCRAEAEVAGVRKVVEVWGDRFRRGGGLEGPAPFREMPLGYTHAYGGEGFADNPVGKGAAEVYGGEGERHLPLPNLLAVQESAPGATGATPVAFGQTGVDWESRRKLAGTYDSTYIEKWMPGFPPDLDWSYFMQAARDQWLPGYFQGAERIRLVNMHPERGELRTALPGIRARIFVLRERGNGEELVELPARLDTVLLFPDREMGVVVHRGLLEGVERDEDDVLGILVAHEADSEPRRSKAHYREFYRGVSDPEQSFRYQLDTGPLIPEGFATEFEVLQERQPDTDESALTGNLQALGDRKREEVEQQVKEAEARAEDRLAASPDAPRVRIQGVHGQTEEAAEQVSPLSEGKVQEILDRALPKKADGSGAVDPARLDLAALDELMELGQQVADDQLEGAVQKLEAQKEEIRSRLPAQEQEAPLARIERQIRLLRGEEAAPLPRFGHVREQYDAQREQLRIRIHNLHALGLGAEELVKAKEHLDALEEELRKALDAAIGGYRQSAHHQSAASSPHPGEEAAIVERLKRNLAAGIQPAGGDFAFTDLSGCALTGADFSGAFLEHADLRGADLRGARLDRAILVFANLEGANLEGAGLREANLGGACLDRANLTGCDATGALLPRASLVEATLRNAVLKEPAEPMREVVLRGADFTGADLAGGVFQELDFAAVNLTEANLAGCQFLQCGLAGTRFDRATLEGANFLQASGEGASFHGAALANGRFLGGCALPGADFSGAGCSMGGFREADLTGADFGEALLDQADFGGARLEGARLDRARLRQAMLHRANLDRCSARGADFMEAWLQEATLRGTDLSGASLYGANLYYITMGATETAGANLAGTILQDWVPDQ
ncbi:DUF2169 family type VI secretion system accessory protein [Thiohalorhabdus sp. Cl-TMA]|uniref:DUF2169 domain-containing protein n=1 Tax=Thiohalorhabdus methylotrophus TaxID=3242694 RepID=A0ABV4TVX3_9GAMM